MTVSERDRPVGSPAVPDVPDQETTETDAPEPAVDQAPVADEAQDGPGGPPRWQMVVVGLVVGVLLGGGMAWWSSRDDGDVPEDSEDAGLVDPDDSEESPEAAAAFIDAWERSRTETYLSGSLLRRTLSSAATMELPIVVAQRPPDRVVSTGGSVQADVEGENTVCDEQLDGMVQCRPGGATSDYAAEVAAEVETLRGYFEGETPIYRVAQSGSCFDLRLTAAIQAPPYGQNARFCFDEASGAPSLQRIERTEGTDEVTLVSVRTDVSDDDIARVAAGDIDMELLGG
jgi:hypothetical protein